jgi:lipopolysaccharide transport system ATP-binding protein
MSSDRDVTISVRGVSKRYEIYDRPRDRLFQMLARGRRQYFREFWALRDVSFDVRRGETVGIIGRNGSGKSTLLQLICGTLNPTAGGIEVHGRVAALLELGAGFNPEFSGRENVFMAAKLLGLTQQQVEERYDRIAAFADIGEFIEQPVKTYSSGMYVRLAFAVNAHVDADILVIDEALAVGDAVFTQKCMRYIRGFKENGTLLFVSHDSAAVQSLCESAVWLAHGRVHMKGPSREVGEAYLKYVFQQSYGEDVKLQDVAAPTVTVASDPQTAPEPLVQDGGATADAPLAAPKRNLEQAQGFRTGRADILDVRMEAADDQARKLFQGGEQVRMRIRAIAHERLHSPIVGFLLRDRLGQDLFGENTLCIRDGGIVPVDAGETFEASFEFRLPLLPNGAYAVMASVADGDLAANVQHHWLHDALIIHVSSSAIRYGLVGIPFDDVRMEICR